MIVRRLGPALRLPGHGIAGRLQGRNPVLVTDGIKGLGFCQKAAFIRQIGIQGRKITLEAAELIGRPVVGMAGPVRNPVLVHEKSAAQELGKIISVVAGNISIRPQLAMLGPVPGLIVGTCIVGEEDRLPVICELLDGHGRISADILPGIRKADDDHIVLLEFLLILLQCGSLCLDIIIFEVICPAPGIEGLCVLCLHSIRVLCPVGI